MRRVTRIYQEQVEALLEKQPEGRNTRFLKASHNLWFRFKNYAKHPPFALLDENDEPVALVFITFSQRSKYANLYEIVTLEGNEGNGYAQHIYWECMAMAFDAGMERLKMLCTPSSVTWHLRNGIIVWAINRNGEVRVDQPLFRTQREQIDFREEAVKDPTIALPNPKVIERLKDEGGLDTHPWGNKKLAIAEGTVESIGDYWFRPTLFEPTHMSLEDFL